MEQKKDEYRIGQQVLTEDDIHVVIKVGKDGVEVFKVKFPNPAEQERIERNIAMKLGGVPLDSYPQEIYNRIRMNTTLDLVIVEHPEWWKSAGDCYDEDLLKEVWDKYLDARDKFGRSLRQGKFKRVG